MNIVVDTSALTAIVFGEPDAETFAGLSHTNAGDVQVGAATWVEPGIVAAR